jgi:Chlorophyll A-B binding protein
MSPRTTSRRGAPGCMSVMHVLWGSYWPGMLSHALSVQEIANGRLAMISFVGYVAQYYATGKGPLQNLTDHLANPWGSNFTTNGVSVPF